MREISAASKSVFRIIVDGSTATAALAQPAIATSLPSAAVLTDDWSLSRIRFGGTDGENETINYQVVLWFRFETGTGTAYIPLVAAKGAATLGALAYGVGTAIGAATNLFADTIADDLGHRGSYVTSPGGDSIAELEIDLRNAEAIEVEVDRGTAATSDVLMQFGEIGGSFSDVEIASTGLATSALQTALNTLVGVSATAFQATITSANASAATQVKAKTAAKRMFIHTIVLSAGAALSLQLQDDTAVTPVVLMEQVYCGANGGAVIQFDPRTPLIVATNKDLDVLASGEGNISVSVFGYLAT